MPDRADYLARTFITRARALETLAADGDVVDLLALSRRLEDMVAKVLAVEVGVVDGGRCRGWRVRFRT